MFMEYTKLSPQQLPQALELARRVFDEFEAPACSPERLETFYNFTSLETMQECWRKGRVIMWGAFEADRLCGVIALTDYKHVGLLFVDNACQRQGVASKLFHLMLADCIRKKVKAVTVNAAAQTVSIYQHLGFVAIDAPREQDGMHFVPMQYNI